MNILALLEPSIRVWWIVFQVFLIIGAGVLLAEVSTRFPRRRGPASRHDAWLAALALTIISPAIAVLAQGSGWGWSVGRKAEPVRQAVPPISEIRVADSGEPRPALPAPVRTIDAAPVQSLPLVSPRASVSISPGGVLVAVWISGLLIGLIRMALGLCWTVRLRSGSQPLDCDTVNRTWAEICRDQGLRTVPPVAHSRRVGGPMIVGCVRPILILPTGLTAKLEPAVLRDILLHEASHVARGDVWAGLLQRVAGLVYWPHPLVPYLNSRLSQAREEVCDNHVLLRGDRCRYATTLLNLAAPGPDLAHEWGGLQLLGKRWTLEQRVTDLLDPARPTMTKSSRAFKLFVVAALFASGVLISLVQMDRPALAASPNPSGTAIWSIEGVVVDPAGQPVANAVVTTRNPRGHEPCRTGQDGRFLLNMTGSVQFVHGITAASPNGELMGHWFTDTPRSFEDTRSVRIVAKPPRLLRVLVKDGQGKPVAGASVAAFDISYEADAKTDKQGVATLALAADAPIQRVAALKSGVGFDDYENYEDAMAEIIKPLPGEITIALTGAQTLRFEARDPQGAPVPGLVMRISDVMMVKKLSRRNYSYPSITSVTTDQEGVAAFDWIPSDSMGAFVATIETSEYDSSRASIILSGPQKRVDNRANVTPKSTIEGTVKFADGKPASGIQIVGTPSRPQNFPRVLARSGPDGSYRLTVSSNRTYDVAVHDNRWASPTHFTVPPRSPRNLETTDFTLQEGVSVTGVVTTLDDGRVLGDTAVGLSDRHLTSYDTETTSFRRTLTDSQGRYQFKVAPGKYILLTQGERQVLRERIEIVQGTPLTRNLKSVGPVTQVVVSGRVVRREGGQEIPVPNADLRLFAKQSPAIRVGKSGADGRFRIMVPTPLDPYMLAAGTQLMAGSTQLVNGQAEYIISLEAGGGITGRLIGIDGKTVPRYSALIRAKAPSYGYETLGAFTDDDGRYRYLALPIGWTGEVSAATRGADGKPNALAAPHTFKIEKPGVLELPDVVLKKVNPD